MTEIVELVNEVDVTELKEGDVVVFDTRSGSRYEVRVLKSGKGNDPEDLPKISVYGGSGLPEPTEVIAVGCFKGKEINPHKLWVGWRLTVAMKDETAVTSTSIQEPIKVIHSSSRET